MELKEVTNDYHDFQVQAMENTSNETKKEIKDISWHRLVVLGINAKTTTEDIEEHFSKYGLIEDISLLKSRKYSSQSYAFITFASLNQIPPVRHVLMGRYVELKKLNPFVSNKKSKMILASGVLTNVDSSTLANYFSKYGEVTDVCKQVKGKVIRFAFITFKEYTSVDEAVKTCIHLIDGKIVDIRKAAD